ncbi:MAG: TlpA family protein disulfide reductase, partial [Proteobacteria bacterium]|nr:TlpA family protein disulfide reductase [Pseudomonadota bacterium]
LRGHALEHAVAELVQENLAKPTDASTKTVESSPQSKSIPATKLTKPATTPQKGPSVNDLQARTMAWIGKPAPDFQVTGLNGEALSLEQYRGQVVLLDFWATWCGPCIVEMPKIKKTYQTYKDQKFQIIGISLDRSREPLDAYIGKEGIAWVNYWDEDRSLRTLYGVRGIPTAFLIDGEGVIRKASLGGFDVETAVAELVKENLAKPTDVPIDTPSDTPEGAQNLEPNVKEIINAAIAAHGGLEKLEAVKSIVMESQSFEHFPDGSMQDEGKYKTYLYADKFRSDWHNHNHKGGMIFDGESVFMMTDGEVKLLPPPEGKSYTTFFKDSLSREPVWLLTKLVKDDFP